MACDVIDVVVVVVLIGVIFASSFSPPLSCLIKMGIPMCAFWFVVVVFDRCYFDVIVVLIGVIFSFFFFRSRYCCLSIY